MAVLRRVKLSLVNRQVLGIQIAWNPPCKSGDFQGQSDQISHSILPALIASVSRVRGSCRQRQACHETQNRRGRVNSQFSPYQGRIRRVRMAWSRRFLPWHAGRSQALCGYDDWLVQQQTFEVVSFSSAFFLFSTYRILYDQLAI